MKRLIAVSILVMLLTSSCIILPIPHKRKYTPRIFGIIKDSNSNKPIEGVTVWIISDVKNPKTDDYYSAKMISGEEGVYNISFTKFKAFFSIWLVPWEGICKSEIIFNHPDYHDKKIPIRKFGSAVYNHNTCSKIKLKLDVSLSKK